MLVTPSARHLPLQGPMAMVSVYLKTIAHILMVTAIDFWMISCAVLTFEIGS